jgi:putative methyltransferase (TIGR04325 family)
MRALTTRASLLARLAKPRQRASVTFTGDYASWEAAAALTTGYDAPAILERTRAALAKVRDGEAAFERDSFLFFEHDYSYLLLAGLLRSAARDGFLSVVDFGGSLGMSYYQCRSFLAPLRLRWSVVDQPAHVECGRAEFANEELAFYYTLDECLAAEHLNVPLLSGVVHLRDPYACLAAVVSYAIDIVIVDRTPFMRDGRDRLTIEHVPEWLYPASYPRGSCRSCASGRRSCRRIDSWRNSRQSTRRNSRAGAPTMGFILKRRALSLER